MDFAALPPEINSGRMYAGAGSAPLMASATAWDQLAAELSTAASSYRQITSELVGGPWLGASSAAMNTATAPYAQWMGATATQAEQTASQARSAAAAYEAAFAATVPPPVIAANRALLASLVATNIVGQNTPAIAATEAHYGEMWAQDAAAMYAYAGSSTAATKLSPFADAPQETSPAAAASQSAAVNQATTTSSGSAASGGLQGVADFLNQIMAFLTSAPMSDITSTTGAAGPFGLFGAAVEFLAAGIEGNLAPLMALALPAVGLASSTDGLGAGLGTLASSYGSSSGAGAVAAGLGESTIVGKLSVPPSWGTAVDARLAATVLPAAGPAGLAASGLGTPGLIGGVPPIGPVGSVVNAPRNGDPRLPTRAHSRVLPAWAAHADGQERTQGRPTEPGRLSSASEHEELERLRRELAEVAMERDAAARLISEAIRS